MALKANSADVRAEIERIENLINDLGNKFMNMFASKDDTARKLNLLSKKIREIFEVISKQGASEDDGMLTKRQLGPVNCASCDKNLVNLCGNPKDFSPHKKMPYRETSERIARYGQGFSKMLSTIQP